VENSSHAVQAADGTLELAPACFLAKRNDRL